MLENIKAPVNKLKLLQVKALRFVFRAICNHRNTLLHMSDKTNRNWKIFILLIDLLSKRVIL